MMYIYIYIIYIYIYMKYLHLFKLVLIHFEYVICNFCKLKRLKNNSLSVLYLVYIYAT